MTQALGPFQRIRTVVKGSAPLRWVTTYRSMAPKSIAARAANLALADVGYTEDPPGSNLTKYGKRWGQDGVPWCGMAVASWWETAGFQVDRALALEIDYVPTLLRLAELKRHGLFRVGANRVRKGDAVCFDFPGGERADHVGLFVRWINKKAGAFEAVEGNTSKAGSQSNGGAVLVKTRSTDQVAGFVRKGR